MRRHQSSGRRRARRLGAVLAVLWGVWGAAPTVWAVNRASEPAPQKPIFQWIFALVMFGFVLAVAFKHSKRSHQ